MVCYLEQKTDMNSKLLSSHAAAIVVMLIVDALCDLHISINIINTVQVAASVARD